MGRISTNGALTLKDLNGDKYYNIYYDNGIARGMGVVDKRFRRENTGFYSSSTGYGNTIEALLDTSKHNALEPTGWIVLGNAWTIGNIIKGVGRYIIPESNQQDMIYCSTYEFNTRFKVAVSSLKYGLAKNTAVRYYPSKKNPRVVDIYGFNLEQLIAQKRILGSFKEAFKTDALKTISNSLATFLGNKEEIFMDENGDLRYFSNNSIAIPPELTDETSFQNNREHNESFRRQLANFMFFGINERKTYFVANENAETIFMQQQLKTDHQYQITDIVENTYTEEKLFQPLLEKYFENVVAIDEETIDFERKGIKYTLKGDTIYDENNEEVLGIELDDGSIFCFNYERYIACHLKDNEEVNDYIKRFKEYLKNPQKFDFNANFYQLGWKVTTEYVKDENGKEIEISVGDNGGKAKVPYNKTISVNLKESNLTVTDTSYHGSNYWAKVDYAKCYNGKYNSANLFPLSQLISLNANYSDTNELVLRNEKLSQSADEDTGNTSYENSMWTPILIKNYVYTTYDTQNQHYIWK